MKKILFILLAAAFSMSVNAQSEGLAISAGSMKNLTIGSNLNVVLVATTPGETAPEVNSEALSKLNISFSDGSLHITKAGSFSGNETVYVVVSELAKLTIGENSSVITRGIIRGQVIKVFINENASARLITRAKVKAYSLGDFDVVSTKNPVITSVAVR